MKKAYKAPAFVTFGRLEELTLGVLGNTPDVIGVNNNNCLTGTATNIGGNTVTIGCTSHPS